MRVSSNKVKDIVFFYHQELTKNYSTDEINELAFRVFEFYLNFTRDEMQTKLHEHINQSNLISIYDAAKRLAASEPLQYVLGEAYFYKYAFTVNNAVLIPRPETEELVEMIFKNNTNKNVSIIDFGTGSGCIPITLKLLMPDAAVFACDISDEALKVAKLNAQKLNAEVDFFNADILHLQSELPMFDIVVSNPPYIKYVEGHQMESRVKDFEPHLALFVDEDDSIIFYKKIITFCVRHLSKAGKLYFELNPLTGVEVKSFAEMTDAFSNIQLHKDLSGNTRFLSAMKK